MINFFRCERCSRGPCGYYTKDEPPCNEKCVQDKRRKPNWVLNNEAMEEGKQYFPRIIETPMDEITAEAIMKMWRESEVK